MTAVLVKADELSELALYTTERAAEILSGDTPGSVTVWFLEQGERDGRFEATWIGRRRMWSHDQLAAVIKACRKPAPNRVPTSRRG